MPLLHWSPRSPYVRKVMVALHERGLAEQVRTVRTHADPMIPHEPLMTINPLSKIPTLELDDGRVLFDSHVIATWIDQYGSGPNSFRTTTNSDCGRSATKRSETGSWISRWGGSQRPGCAPNHYDQARWSSSTDAN